MAKKTKHEKPSLERMVTESPSLMKIAEDFQIDVQVKEIQRIIALLEDRITQLQGRGLAAATNFSRLGGNLLLQKRLAKFIVRFCFRDNTPLEDLHADPGSRITQEEMKALMIAAVQNSYTVVGLLCGERDNRPQVAAFEKYLEMATGSTDLLTALGRHDFNPEWDEPRELLG